MSQNDYTITSTGIWSQTDLSLILLYLSPTFIFSAFSLFSCSFRCLSSSFFLSSSGSNSLNLPNLFLSLNALTESAIENWMQKKCKCYSVWKALQWQLPSFGPKMVNTVFPITITFLTNSVNSFHKPNRNSSKKLRARGPQKIAPSHRALCYVIILLPVFLA